MNVKNFIVGGIVGGIVDWLLGWLFYGKLFKDTFPMDDAAMNMCMISCGCFAVGFFVSYLFSGLTSITSLSAGLKAGAIIGLFQGLIAGFFSNEAIAMPNYKIMAIGVVISMVMVAAVGASELATVVSELAASALIAAGNLMRVNFDLPPRTFYVLHHQQRYRTKASLALGAIVASRCS